MSKDYMKYIESKPSVMVGKPCIKGTRITIESVLEMLACGMNYAEMMSDFPRLNENNIRATLMYAAHHLSDESAA